MATPTSAPRRRRSAAGRHRDARCSTTPRSGRRNAASVVRIESTGRLLMCFSHVVGAGAAQPGRADGQPLRRRRGDLVRSADGLRLPGLVQPRDGRPRPRRRRQHQADRSVGSSIDLVHRRHRADDRLVGRVLDHPRWRRQLGGARRRRSGSSRTGPSCTAPATRTRCPTAASCGRSMGTLRPRHRLARRGERQRRRPASTSSRRRSSPRPTASTTATSTSSGSTTAGSSRSSASTRPARASSRPPRDEGRPGRRSARPRSRARTSSSSGLRSGAGRLRLPRRGSGAARRQRQPDRRRRRVMDVRSASCTRPGPSPSMSRAACAAIQTSSRWAGTRSARSSTPTRMPMASSSSGFACATTPDARPLRSGPSSRPRGRRRDSGRRRSSTSAARWSDAAAIVLTGTSLVGHGPADPSRIGQLDAASRRAGGR